MMIGISILWTHKRRFRPAAGYRDIWSVSEASFWIAKSNFRLPENKSVDILAALIDIDLLSYYVGNVPYKPLYNKNR